MRTRYAKVALALVLFAAMGLAGLNAQTTVQIGTTASSNIYPVDLWYTFTASDAIYTAADLATAGWVCGNGTITSIKWYSTQSPTYGQGGTVRIFMGNTTSGSFASTTPDSTGLTLVWAGSLPTLSPNWINFTLQTPFAYTNGSNLRVLIRRLEPTTYQYYDSHYWGAHTPPAANMHRAGSDDTQLPTYLGMQSTRPSIQLTFQQFCDPPPTIIVTNSGGGCASSAGQTIVATITDNGTINEARIWFRKNGGTWYSATQQSVVGTSYTFYINHATVGGAGSGDAIQWYIAARDNNNTVGTSPGGGGGSATPIGSIPPGSFYQYNLAGSPPHFQNFDVAGHGWTFGQIGGGLQEWRVGTPNTTFGAALSGANVLAWGPTSGVYGNNATCWAMSPPFSFVGAPFDPVVIFDIKYQTEDSWDGVTFEYTTNGGSTWTILGTVADPNGSNWFNGSPAYNPCLGIPSFIGTSGATTWRHAVRTLTGMAGLPCVQFRFRACSDGSQTYAGAAIDDFRIGYYPQKDIAVNSINVSYATNRWAFVEQQSHTVSAVIANNGWEANPTSVTLVYKVGSAPANAADGVAQTFTPAWAGSTATCVFTTPYIPPTVGPATIYVRAFYTGDLGPANDISSKMVNAQNIKVFGFEDFEGLQATGLPNFNPGWTVVNGGGAGTWGVFTAGPAYVAGYIQDANPDDYLISPPALLQAGSSYRIRFKYYGCNWGTGPATLKLLYGKTPVPAQMTVLNTWSVPNNAVFTDALGPIAGVAPYFNTDPAGAANYYIAFQASTPAAATGCIALDDIILDENPTPPPKIGWGLPGSAQGQHIDNPGTPMQILAIYKKPGKITKTYEVVSTTYNYGSPGDFLWDVTTSTPWIKVVKSIANPTSYLASNPFNPARPRQLQTFNLEVDPTGLMPGTYNGQITLYGRLYNSQYPGPAGIGATNDPFPVTVQLTVMNAGSGVPGSSSSLRACNANMIVRPQPYVFTDPANGLPFAAVTVTAGTIPTMCIEAFPGQLPPGIARYRYIQRYFNVTAGGTGWTATIDWYYTDTEAQIGGVTRPDLLRNIRQLVNGGAWQDPTAGVVSTPFPNLYYVRGVGYNTGNIAGNHCLATNWTPKEGGNLVPSAYALGQNYPNPFNPSTKIDFAVPEEVPVKLTVYNSLGDEVLVLVNETLQAGSYSIPFDASALPSGTYMYRLTAGTFSDTKRMLLAK